MAQVRYEALCPRGNRLQTSAKETARRLTDVVRLLLDAEEDRPENTARYRAELDSLKTQRTRGDGVLMQHVAHCEDGCIRARGGDLAFAAEGQTGVFDRAPTHSKPPMPTAGQLAELIRDGQTVDDLATTYERHPHTIQQRLTHAGFSSHTGEPRAKRSNANGLIDLHVDDQPWAEDALCSQTDPEAFFPEKGGSTRDAKSVCSGCIVQAECLDYALEHQIRFGIWGGLSERQRRALQPVTNDTGSAA